MVGVAISVILPAGKAMYPAGWECNSGDEGGVEMHQMWCKNLPGGIELGVYCGHGAV